MSAATVFKFLIFFLVLRVYDPGYVNTACCESSICKIDGEKGELTFRGYSIEELVEKATFLEVAYLLIFGELPDKDQLELWETKITRHTFIHENLVQLMKNFRYVRFSSASQRFA